ncbi:MAG: YjdF family protein [Anaerovoracaceae bacterium]
MDKVTGALTVFFEDPFWVGVLERTENGKLTVCKVTFGAEPRESEVLSFMLKYYERLKFSPSVDVDVRQKAVNPKRMQREAKKQILRNGIGTRSQQALQMQREEHKLERRAEAKRLLEAEQQRRFELRQQKRKQKHRGH